MKKALTTNSIRFYEFLLQMIIWILLIFSLIAVIIVHAKMFLSPNYKFSFSLTTIGGYFNIYAEFGGLFKATVATIVAYLGLKRLQVASEANSDKLKQDHFVEWRTVQDVRLVEIEKTDPYMKREFTKIRQKLFMELYVLDFKIENREQLSKIFDSNFKEFIPFFEQMNEKYMEFGGIYPNITFSYTGQNFSFLFGGCIEKSYDNLYADILDLHRQNLDENRFIDSSMYQSALQNYLKAEKK